MPIRKASSIREIGTDQLQRDLKDLKQETVHLRFQQATGQLENPARIRTIRREIARILSVLNERAIASESAEPTA